MRAHQLLLVCVAVQLAARVGAQFMPQFMGGGGPGMPPMGSMPMQGMPMGAMPPMSMPFAMPMSQPKLPVVVMPFHSNAADRMKADKRRIRKKRRGRERRIRRKRPIQSSESFSSSDSRSCSSEEYYRNRRSGRGGKNILTPMVSYVKRNGDVVYQKKINTEKAKEYLENKQSTESGDMSSRHRRRYH